MEDRLWRPGQKSTICDRAVWTITYPLPMATIKSNLGGMIS